MIIERVAESTRAYCPSGYYYKRFTCVACRRHASNSGGVPAQAKYVCTAAHTYTQKRLAPTSADRRARSTLAHTSACLNRTPVLRSPDERRPRGEHTVARLDAAEVAAARSQLQRAPAVSLSKFSLSLSLSFAATAWLAASLSPSRALPEISSVGDGLSPSLVANLTPALHHCTLAHPTPVHSLSLYFALSLANHVRLGRN